MLVSELITRLKALQEEHGDLEVQMVVPEGPYERLEGEPDVLAIGWADTEGEFVSEERRSDMLEDTMEELDTEDEDEAIADMDLEGPFICIGRLAEV